MTSWYMIHDDIMVWGEFEGETDDDAEEGAEHQTELEFILKRRSLPYRKYMGHVFKNENEKWLVD